MTAEIPTMSRALSLYGGHSKDYTVSRQMPKLSYSFSSETPLETDGILPYMARLHSPIRVNFSPTKSMKRKSRISNQTLAAVFNYKPVKRGDRLNITRFKPPDSTLPSLQYLSPWISVTKGDYRDPRQPQDGRESVFVNSRSSASLQRSVTDLGFDIHDNNGGTSEFGFSSKATTRIDSGAQSTLDSRVARDASAKTQNSDKRVTFSENHDDRTSDDLERNSISPQKGDCPPTDLHNATNSDKLDFYSGYFPTEIPENILNPNDNQQPSSVGEKIHLHVFERDGQFYKPLIGDRSMFMRDSYSVKPAIYQSDIDQLRFEGHNKLMKSRGQAPAHFSMFKDRGTLITPKGKGMYLEEALKRQHRLAKSAGSVGIRRQKTAIELYEGQRQRTYDLQKRAREMISK